MIKFDDFIQNGIEFLIPGFVDHIRIIDSYHGLIGGDNQDIKVIYLFKFGSFCIGRTGHSGQFIVHSEIILKGNRGQSLIFVFYFDVFFGFKRLMQPFTVPASGHQAAGKFIDDDHFIIFDDIVNITFKQGVSF